MMQRLFDFFQFDKAILKDFLELTLRLGIFLLLAIVSPFIGRLVPRVLKGILKLLYRLVGTYDETGYNRFIKPYHNPLALISTLIFVAIALNVVIQYERLYTFLGFIVYFALSISIIWFASKITRQIVHHSVIAFVKRWFGEVNEVVLVFETLIYVLIVLSAVIIFAVGLRINLVALITSLGIGGVAVAFGAQQTISRLFGTMELYLDRPYVPGEYIRVNFNPYAEDVYGRVESIGLRSTKIRIVAQNTLMIVPNSVMADKNIENISRGKKIMAMLCLDFIDPLKEGEKALISRTVEETSQIFWGFDRASTRIQFCPLDHREGTRTRIIFFISSSGQSSTALRKRLLDLANDELAKKLATYNLQFTVPESVIYIDSPMSM